MKISLLSGAYKNAGDFLIVQRCKELLMDSYPDIEICEYERKRSLKIVLDEVNKSDAIVLAGGPAYIKNMYPDKIPLVDNLENIKVPIFAMAMGWKGMDILPQTIYNYNLSEDTMRLLNRIEKDGFLLGCRDFYSQRILHKNKIENTIMTGCAAWYNLKYIDSNKLRNNHKIEKICISDPASSKNFKQLLDVVRFIKKRYPKAKLTVVFHRGIKTDELTPHNIGNALLDICRVLQTIDVSYKDISYDFKGMDIYNECDLHIGYRVHAHIYNLSNRNRSILIEEDGRGGGVNQALGLRSILAYDCLKHVENKYILKIKNHICSLTSDFVIRELEDYLQELEQQNYIQLEWAFERMIYYYQQMRKHLLQLKNIGGNNYE